MARRGSDSPVLPAPVADSAARLRAAQEDVYGRHPDPEGPQRLEAVRSELLHGHEVRPASTIVVSAEAGRPPASHDVRRGGSPSRWARGISAIALIAFAGLAAGWTTRPPPAPSLQEQVRQRVLDSRGTIAAEDYYRLFPDDLPIDWRAAVTVSSRRGLESGWTGRIRPSEASSWLLIVPACSSVDRHVGWQLLAADGRVLAAADPACGTLGGDLVQFSAADRAAGLRLAVSSPGPVPFSVTVFEQ